MAGLLPDNHQNSGELAEWLAKSPGAILNISVLC